MRQGWNVFRFVEVGGNGFKTNEVGETSSPAHGTGKAWAQELAALKVRTMDFRVHAVPLQSLRSIALRLGETTDVSPGNSEL